MRKPKLAIDIFRQRRAELAKRMDKNSVLIISVAPGTSAQSRRVL